MILAVINSRHRTLAFAALLTFTAASYAAQAVAQDDEPAMVDARLEGYGSREKPVTVALAPGNTSLTWVLMVILGGLAVGVMFKHTKRSHLD